MAELNPHCCANPAVTVDYKPRGSYTDIAGIHTYEIYPIASSTCGIIAVHDVFGMASQTLQGADRMASAVNARVIVPDFFDGHALDMSLYPPDTEEKMKGAKAWQEKYGGTGEGLSALMRVRRALSDKYPSVKVWGVYGLCWGGKVAILASGKDSLFAVSGTAHPGRLESDDADKLTIPHICLFSQKDAGPEVVEKYKSALKAKDNVEVDQYSNMQHGWMGARGFYNGEESVKEFERGYDQLAAFFSKHLK